MVATTDSAARVRLTTARRAPLRPLVFVEVKGTTGTDTTVIVTAGEVTHAKEHPKRCILVIVTGIALQHGRSPVAAGGTVTVFGPWDPDRGSLLPISFRHVPA
jgi:hypothetical protein